MKYTLHNKSQNHINEFHPITYHVNEGDEDGRSTVGRNAICTTCPVPYPLVEHQKNQVPEQAGQENYLGDELTVDVHGLVEEPVERERSKDR